MVHCFDGIADSHWLTKFTHLSINCIAQCLVFFVYTFIVTHHNYNFGDLMHYHFKFSALDFCCTTANHCENWYHGTIFHWLYELSAYWLLMLLFIWSMCCVIHTEYLHLAPSLVKYFARFKTSGKSLDNNIKNQGFEMTNLAGNKDKKKVIVRVNHARLPSLVSHYVTRNW